MKSVLAFLLAAVFSVAALASGTTVICSDFKVVVSEVSDDEIKATLENMVEQEIPAAVRPIVLERTTRPFTTVTKLPAKTTKSVKRKHVSVYTNELELLKAQDASVIGFIVSRFN